MKVLDRPPDVPENHRNEALDANATLQFDSGRPSSDKSPEICLT